MSSGFMKKNKKNNTELLISTGMNTLFENNLDMYQPDMLTGNQPRPEVIDWMTDIDEKLVTFQMNMQEVRTRYIIRLDDGTETWIKATVRYISENVMNGNGSLRTLITKSVKLKKGGYGDTLMPTETLDPYELDYFHQHMESYIGNNDYINIPSDLMKDIVGFFRKYTTDMTPLSELRA